MEIRLPEFSLALSEVQKVNVFQMKTQEVKLASAVYI